MIILIVVSIFIFSLVLCGGFTIIMGNKLKTEMEEVTDLLKEMVEDILDKH